MLYIHTSFKAGKSELFLVCFQIHPGVFYLMDDIVGVGKDFSDDKEFQDWLVTKNAVKAVTLYGSESAYCTPVIENKIPGKAVTALTKLIQTLTNNPSECFYFLPCLSEASVIGMARHHVRAVMPEHTTEEEITKATKAGLSEFKDSNRRTFLKARQRALSAE